MAGNLKLKWKKEGVESSVFWVLTQLDALLLHFLGSTKAGSKECHFLFLQLLKTHLASWGPFSLSLKLLRDLCCWLLSSEPILGTNAIHQRQAGQSCTAVASPAATRCHCWTQVPYSLVVSDTLKLRCVLMSLLGSPGCYIDGFHSHGYLLFPKYGQCHRDI